MKISARSPRPFFQARSALAIALLALAPAVAARAQASAASDDSEVVRLDKVHVAGLRETDYASTLSTGGLKARIPLIETPQAISAITRFQIADQAAQNIQEVLRYTPGVRAEMYGVDNRGDWFTLRGGSKGSTVLRQAGVWTRIVDTFVPLHYGTFGGLPVKILWCLGSLAPGTLAITGFMICRLRRRELATRARLAEAFATPSLSS